MLDKIRQQLALGRAEQMERDADDLRADAQRLEATAAALRQRWQLPPSPRSPVPPTRPVHFDT